MNERDAQDLIRMIESNWHFDLGPARSMWRAELMMWDAELATKAVAHLSRRQSYKIVLADVVQILEMYHRNLKDEQRRAQEAKALTEGKRGYAPPEWVLVWAWDRNRKVAAAEKGKKGLTKAEVDFRSFPQQGDWADPRQTMTTQEYEALREEWVTAGSPKEKVAMVGEV